MLFHKKSSQIFKIPDFLLYILSVEFESSLLVGHARYLWGTLIIGGARSLLVGHARYWWGMLIIGFFGGACSLLVGHAHYWWGTLVIGGARSLTILQTPYIKC